MINWRTPYSRAIDRAARLLLVLVNKHYPGQVVQPSDNLYGLLDQIDNVTASLIKPGQQTVLMDIRKSGRSLVFTFKTGDDIWNVECYGTMSDDVQGWKERAGLK